MVFVISVYVLCSGPAQLLVLNRYDFVDTFGYAVVFWLYHPLRLLAASSAFASQVWMWYLTLWMRVLSG